MNAFLKLVELFRRLSPTYRRTCKLYLQYLQSVVIGVNVGSLCVPKRVPTSLSITSKTHCTVLILQRKATQPTTYDEHHLNILFTRFLFKLYSLITRLLMMYRCESKIWVPYNLMPHFYFDISVKNKRKIKFAAASVLHKAVNDFISRRKYSIHVH